MANAILTTLLFSFVFLHASPVLAEDHYFDQHEKGWHWYDDPKASDESDNDDEENPITQMNAVRATIERALNKAVLNPSRDNVKNYISLQNQMAAKANQFDHSWQAVLLENPELNYSLIHPTNNLAKQVESDQTHLFEENAIRQLAKNYQLYFFYRSTCPYCQRFAPIVRDFAASYGFNTLAITTDGISLPEFPDSYADQGESQIYGITVEPALFMVNPITHKAIRIATGLTSQDEIKQNIVALLTHFEGDVQ